MNLGAMSADAERLIREHVRETPLEPSPVLSELTGCEVSLKLENFQVTGSFKARGVLAKLMSTDRNSLSAGVITASTGNHGLACAHAARVLGIDAEIVVSEGVPDWRRSALRKAGVTVTVHGSECGEAEVWARRRGELTGRTYVPPYNDPDIVAGQGTIGMELARQLERVDVVAASVGGGGLLAGVAGALKDRGSAVRALGCLPENSPAMYDSIAAGRIVRSRVEPTLSDATAGNIEDGSMTFELCRRYVDDWVLVSEDEIRHAMEIVYDSHDMVVEGAAGTAVAGFLKRFQQLGLNRSTQAVIIICGGNVSPARLAGIVVPGAR